MKKKRNTDFYLLRQKSLSEGELFVTDYINTKQRLERLEQDFLILERFVKNYQTKKKNWK